MTIDKTKGIVCKPMPKYWYDYRTAADAVESNPGDDVALMNKTIVADKKPYFMIYVYPVLMKEYKEYAKNTNLKAIMEFNKTIEQLDSTPEDELSDRQKEFMSYYRRMTPVGVNRCTMNRICRMVEEQTDDLKVCARESNFDYGIMKSDKDYKLEQYYNVKKLYDVHVAKMKDLAKRHNTKEISKEDYGDYQTSIKQRFSRDAYVLCNNVGQLCNIILDMCYRRENTKQFMWDVVGDDVVDILERKNGGASCYPARDDNGEFEYCAQRYTMKRVGRDEDGNSVE